MQIYFIRHGQTEYNRLSIVQGGGIDSSLNNTGRAQAAAFFEHYREVPFEKVVTSTLQRTHQTVAGFRELGLPWEQFAEINEINWGVHEGKPSKPDMVEDYKRVTDSWRAGGLDARVKEGESAAELGQRLRRFIEQLKGWEQQRLLVCSHGRTMRALMCLLDGNPLTAMDSYQHSNTGLYTVERQNDRFIFDLKNDTRHLDDLNI